MKIHQLALYPFAVLYDGATRLRNRLFDLQFRESHAFDPVIINVGNLSVGGTGKTPMIEYLIRLLHDSYKVATLSRGYGRKTKGYRLAGEQDNATTLGDEPFQLYLAWKEKIIVAVGEKRAEAIPKIMEAHPSTAVILLDDAYQHRAVQRDLNILLTTWEKPFFRDFVLPSGRLREARKGASRADLVVVTKCPAKPSAEMVEKYRRNIAVYLKKGVPVYFSTLAYDLPKAFNGYQDAAPEKVVLVSGLANARLFEEEAGKHFKVLRHFRYPDHHDYTREEIKQITDWAEEEKDCAILTTEKDAAKWHDKALAELLKNIPVFTLPVRHAFIGEGTGFDEQVLQIMKTGKSEAKVLESNGN